MTDSTRQGDDVSGRPASQLAAHVRFTALWEMNVVRAAGGLDTAMLAPGRKTAAGGGAAGGLLQRAKQRAAGVTPGNGASARNTQAVACPAEPCRQSSKPQDDLTLHHTLRCSSGVLADRDVGRAFGACQRSRAIRACRSIGRPP